MKIKLSIYEILFVVFIGAIVGKINKWDIFLTMGIYILVFYLFNIFVFEKLINKMLQY
jgi:hypothetical protein